MPTAPPREDFQDARAVCETLGIPLHRVSFASRVPRTGVRPLPARIRGRPHAESGRALQPGNQVRRLPGLHAPPRRRADRHRSLRAARARRLAPAPEGARTSPRIRAISCMASAPDALATTLFPLGELAKDEVRRRAHAAGLRGIRQAGQHRYLLHRRAAFSGFSRAATLRTERARSRRRRRVIGEHRGLALYTLGQRSGFGVGGQAGAADAPWYVADKDARRNALIVVQDQEHPLLMSDAFEVEQVQWLALPQAPAATWRRRLRLRRQDAIPPRRSRMPRPVSGPSGRCAGVIARLRRGR